jgi:hypothetical protein
MAQLTVREHPSLEELSRQSVRQRNIDELRFSLNMSKLHGSRSASRPHPDGLRP